MLRLIFASIILLAGCSKKAEYLHSRNPPEIQYVDSLFNIHEFTLESMVDILWVIDDSGSMGGIQQNIVTNAALFMQKFIQKKDLDWKMGIVSTDSAENPFLGFNTLFDRNTVDPVTTFQKVVNSLGVKGSGEEHVFQNIDRHLFGQQVLPFRRTGAHLIVIMVSDEHEQSEEYFNKSVYQGMNFYKYVLAQVSPSAQLRFYGAFGFGDMQDCSNYEMYKGSPFETVINMSRGFAISACSPRFGDDLAKIGDDIVSLVRSPKILLSSIPKQETIRVFFHDQELFPGDKETGGHWYYDYYFNAIVFYNIDFIPSGGSLSEEVRVTYTEDDGVVRTHL